MPAPNIQSITPEALKAFCIMHIRKVAAKEHTDLIAQHGYTVEQVAEAVYNEAPELHHKHAIPLMVNRQMRYDIATMMLQNIPPGVSPEKVEQLRGVVTKLEAEFAAEAEFVKQYASQPAQSNYIEEANGNAALIIDGTPAGLDTFFREFRTAHTEEEKANAALQPIVDEIKAAEAAGADRLTLHYIAERGMAATNIAEKASIKYLNYQKAANLMAETDGKPCPDYPPGEAVELVGQHTKLIFRKHNDHYHYDYRMRAGHEVQA